jgi:hypothetical protein
VSERRIEIGMSLRSLVRIVTGTALVIGAFAFWGCRDVQVARG